MPRIASIGECMVELSPRQGGLFGLGFGGDTLNTAIYLARLGQTVDYLTALGDDPISDRMLAAWAAEGVGTSQVRRMPGRLPGLYLIETDDKGERRFHYWRDRAPARELFADEPPDLAPYDLIYLSGITLAIYGEAGRARLFDALDAARARGARIAFDTNYRPRLWADASAARAAMEAMLVRTDIALPGFDDACAIWGQGDAASHRARFRALGAAEVVLKQGPEPALIASVEGEVAVRADHVGRVVDSTAAGDSFNAGYLAARLAGASPVEGARRAHHLAAAVIGHPGAIIPRAAMPDSGIAALPA
ncbi:sugar kinase [Desertibaculum subflavum]|uniref:sugar kinase n=1 Tax=Desertibaculum subflavum TaxID=2268458 RepID=UPI000E66A5D3